jgi:hypothetical protein
MVWLQIGHSALARCLRAEHLPACCNAAAGGLSVEWRSLPEDASFCSPIQWVGRCGGEDVAWIIEWSHWGDRLHRWSVATEHSAEQVLQAYGSGCSKLPAERDRRAATA